MSSASSTGIDWSILRISLIIFFFSVCISIAIGISSYWYLGSITTQLEKENKTLAETKKTYEQLANTLNQLQSEDYQFFNQLTSRRFYEVMPPSSNIEEAQIQSLLLNSQLNEHIQSLINNVRDIQGTVKNTDAVPYTPAFLKEAKEQTPAKKETFLFKTRFLLNLEILHEIDLLNLLEQIHSSVPKGILNTAACQLTRLGENPHIDYPLKPNLNVTCVLYWYNLYIIDNRH
ncbi:hypothetical protein BegalDRAFT_0814 [Beggiatoa alba B18LD]|uniref:Uncharacterized protein n=1 Tax=Beggiatoa alba B18LD TaxID=395493 RepID=I3CDN2_9GAMM|nr:hypothetical protein [Beggiatoa alba]EIJ41725.1 hypothetical protein BegalDRAFT_0814 [Beggiatoa alba B18LD]